MSWVNLNDLYATKSELATKVPTSRTINGKALSSNVTLAASDIKLSDSTTLQSAWDSISQYSTSETNTSKTWINGKSIYRRVIQFGIVPTGENRYDLNFSYETMISAIFMGGSKDGSSFEILPAYPNDTYWRCDVTVATTQIVTRIGTSHGSTYITGIFEYTKK